MWDVMGYSFPSQTFVHILCTCRSNTRKPSVKQAVLLNIVYGSPEGYLRSSLFSADDAKTLLPRTKAFSLVDDCLFSVLVLFFLSCLIRNVKPDHVGLKVVHCGGQRTKACKLRVY